MTLSKTSRRLVTELVTENSHHNLGQEFYSLYKALKENTDTEFCVTDQQHEQFNVFFTQLQHKYLMLQGEDYMATIRRLGLIAFRIAMIFTTLRILETGDFSEKQVCSDGDFQAALSMIKILVKHSSHVFSELPVDVIPTKSKDRKEQFLDLLPEKFNHQDFVDLAKSISIPKSTADRFMGIFCAKGFVRRDNHGTYTNFKMGEAKNEG